MGYWSNVDAAMRYGGLRRKEAENKVADIMYSNDTPNEKLVKLIGLTLEDVAPEPVGPVGTEGDDLPF